jgi:hypothetical protein
MREFLYAKGMYQKEILMKNYIAIYYNERRLFHFRIPGTVKSCCFS